MFRHSLSLDALTFFFYKILCVCTFSGPFPCGRICKYVYVNGGFSLTYDTIQEYTTAIHRNPTLHHEFLTTRQKWIKMKVDDPSLKLRGNQDLVPQRLVNLEQTQDYDYDSDLITGY